MAWKTYKELIVWQKSMDLVNKVYSLINEFPKKETYALSSQMIRAVVSVPSNIAEGQGRNSNNEFIRFLSFSRGSLYELETQIMIANNQKYINDNSFDALIKDCSEIERMLAKLIESLK